MAHKIIRKIDGFGDLDDKKRLLQEAVKNQEYVKEQGDIRLSTTIVIGDKQLKSTK